MKEEVKHECKYNQLIIESRTHYLSDDPGDEIDTIVVSLDCSCEESDPRVLIEFFNTEILSACNNFKGWFNAVVGYFVQNDYRIIDRRK